MLRAYFTIDETNPNIPVPELHVNGQALRMTVRELRALLEDGTMALNAMQEFRTSYHSRLAEKYVEVRNVA